MVSNSRQRQFIEDPVYIEQDFPALVVGGIDVLTYRDCPNPLFDDILLYQRYTLVCRSQNARHLKHEQYVNRLGVENGLHTVKAIPSYFATANGFIDATQLRSDVHTISRGVSNTFHQLSDR